MRRALARAGAVLVAAAALTAALAMPAAAASASTPASASVVASTQAAPDGDDILVTVPQSSQGRRIVDAQLRWGINRESGGGAFAGGCNFLSAGRAGGDFGPAHLWAAGDGLYRASEGNVRIEKPRAGGDWATATFDDRCRDANGQAVSASSTTSTTGNQVVVDGGTGTIIAGVGLELRWQGSFTVVFYGGMTYWSVTDPVLTLDASGDGRLMGTASGYGTSMEDLTKWEPIPERSIVLAELRGADIGTDIGFSVLPEYLGVAAAPGTGQSARSSANAAYWGAFPASFLDFHRLTGQLGYWLATGGQRDPAKPATPLYVSYDARTPVDVDPPSAGGSSGADPSNPVRQGPPAPAPGPAPVAPAAAPAQAYPATAALTTTPERAGLVPGVSGAALPPVVLPLLGSALALLTAIVAVLNMMGMLPWQKPAA